MGNIYRTRQDLIAGEIIPALGEHAADFDIDGIYNELRAEHWIVYRRHEGAVDGLELIIDPEGFTFWLIVERHAL